MVETLLNVRKISLLFQKLKIRVTGSLIKVTSCQAVDGVVKTASIDTTVADLDVSDKYELEIQTKLKKSKIKVAKGAPKMNCAYNKIDHYSDSYLFKG